jgi:hypothetical protein
VTEPEIVVTLGPCDDMRAEVFVRAVGDVAAGTRLSGRLSGPRRGRDVTLPTTARLVPLPESATGPAARAILTEPAFWTPDLPNRYRLEASLESPAGGSRAVDAWIGLRRLGVRGRSFWLDGRRWVLRAVVGPDDLPAAKAVSVGLVTAGASEPLLERADEIGVGLVPLLDAAAVVPARVAALARHPSALLAVIVDGPPDDLPARFAAIRGVKGTLLVGAAVDGGLSPPPAAGGPDFLVVMLPPGGVPHADWRGPLSRPVVAWRRDAGASAGPRAACDALQRDLAAWGLAGGRDALPWDWAGYLVG